jgi:hypothetical protein
MMATLKQAREDGLVVIQLCLYCLGRQSNLPTHLKITGFLKTTEKAHLNTIAFFQR